jgi:hypothetical protein
MCGERETVMMRRTGAVKAQMKPVSYLNQQASL